MQNGKRHHSTSSSGVIGERHISTSVSGVIGERCISNSISGVIGCIHPSMTVTTPMGGSAGFAIGCALLIQWLDEDLLAWRGSAGFGGLCNWSCMFFGCFFFFCFFACCGSSSYCNASSASGQRAARFAIALTCFANQLVWRPAGSCLPPRQATSCFFSYVQPDVRMQTHVEMKQA